jgi:plasmid stabilization system protein ParE
MSSEQNTEYRVELAVNAVIDLDAIYGRIDAENSQGAAEWYNGLEELVFSLDRLPNRGMETIEDKTLRQLLYGNKPHVYRIIYLVNEAERRVFVAHIRHGARDAFQPQNIWK